VEKEKPIFDKNTSSALAAFQGTQHIDDQFPGLTTTTDTTGANNTFWTYTNATAPATSFNAASLNLGEK